MVVSSQWKFIANVRNMRTTEVETNVGIGAAVVMIIWPCWLFVKEFDDKIDWAVPTPYEIGVAIAVPLCETENMKKFNVRQIQSYANLYNLNNFLPKNFKNKKFKRYSFRWVEIECLLVCAGAIVLIGCFFAIATGIAWGCVCGGCSIFCTSSK